MLFKDTVNCQSVVSPSILQLFINWSENEEPRFPTDSVVRLYLHVHACMYLHFRLRYWCKVVTTKVIIWMRRRYISSSSFGNRSKIKRQRKIKQKEKEINKIIKKDTTLWRYSHLQVQTSDWLTEFPTDRQTDKLTDEGSANECGAKTLTVVSYRLFQVAEMHVIHWAI